MGVAGPEREGLLFRVGNLGGPQQHHRLEGRPGEGLEEAGRAGRGQSSALGGTSNKEWLDFYRRNWIRRVTRREAR